MKIENHFVARKAAFQTATQTHFVERKAALHATRCFISPISSAILKQRIAIQHFLDFFSGFWATVLKSQAAHFSDMFGDFFEKVRGILSRATLDEQYTHVILVCSVKGMNATVVMVVIDGCHLSEAGLRALSAALQHIAVL